MLLFMEMPQVVTASKSAQDIDKAPSVITVWTDQDIKQMGIRTTKELLSRTVGFFVNLQYATPIIGDRGMIADSNDAFLFMIDGHPINSILQSGPGSYFVFPVLANIKRVEIVRGPGSTLWGGDAALGVINFITKDGGDVNGLQVSADYSGNDQMQSQNILYGKKTGANSDVMFSLTHMQASGFYEKMDDLKPGGPNDDNYGTPNWGVNPNSWIETLNGGRQIGPIGDIYNSWEMHGKAKLDNFTLSAHVSELWEPDMWGLNKSPDKMFFLERQTSYLEGTQLQPILDNFTVETKLYGQAILNSQHASTYLSSPGVTGEQEQDLGREIDWGGDLLFNLKLDSVRQDIKFGVHTVLSELSPIYTYSSFDADANTGTIVPDVSPHTNDLALAGFLEDDWKALDNLDVILGLRADTDSLRDKTTAWLPRGGIVWNFSGPMTVKYLYNTGYVRPEVNDGYLGGTPEKLDNTYGNYFQIGETKSEKITAHDLQFAYNNKETYASATLYHMELDDFFDYSGNFMIGSDGKQYRMATVNTNNLTSEGLELEFRQKLTSQINCYGNYSFVLHSQVNQFDWNEKGFIATLANSAQFTDQREMTGFPRHSWNLGFNASIIDNLTVNLNYRGWTGMWTEIKSAALNSNGSVAIPAQYAYLGPEHFVDVSFLYSKIFGLPLDINVFVKNLLNNADSKIGLPLQGGYWAEEGFSLGAKVTYKF
jgi:iron complex outermembrane receptor protein